MCAFLIFVTEFNSNRATEILDGIRQEFLDNKIPFTQNEVHLPTISIYHNPYESQLPPLDELEYNRYQYAKALFQMRQFDGVTNVLDDSKSPRLYFLRLYAKYLASELIFFCKNVLLICVIGW